MQINHHITLSQDAWDNLAVRLMHPAESTQEKINAFFKEIESDIRIVRMDDHVIVESDMLDEHLIMSLLLDTTAKATTVSNMHNVCIHAFLNYANIHYEMRNACEDMYQNQLNAVTASSEFAIADVYQTALLAS